MKIIQTFQPQGLRKPIKFPNASTATLWPGYAPKTNCMFPLLFPPTLSRIYFSTTQWIPGPAIGESARVVPPPPALLLGLFRKKETNDFCDKRYLLTLQYPSWFCLQHLSHLSHESFNHEIRLGFLVGKFAYHVMVCVEWHNLFIGNTKSGRGFVNQLTSQQKSAKSTGQRSSNSNSHSSSTKSGKDHEHTGE